MLSIPPRGYWRLLVPGRDLQEDDYVLDGPNEARGEVARSEDIDDDVTGSLYIQEWYPLYDDMLFCEIVSDGHYLIMRRDATLDQHWQESVAEPVVTISQTTPAPEHAPNYFFL